MSQLLPYSDVSGQSNRSSDAEAFAEEASMQSIDSVLSSDSIGGIYLERETELS